MADGETSKRFDKQHRDQSLLSATYGNRIALITKDYAFSAPSASAVQNNIGSWGVRPGTSGMRIKFETKNLLLLT